MEVTLELMIGMMAVLLVMLLGMITFLVRASRKGKSKKDAPPLPDEDAPAQAEIVEGPSVSASPAADKAPRASSEPVATPPPVPAVPAPEPQASPGMQLLMQVWQDGQGFLVVELEGQRYRRLFDIRDGLVGRRLLNVINRLVAFSKGQESRDLSAVPAEAAPSVSPPPAPVSAQPPSTLPGPLSPPPETPPRRTRLTTDPVPFRRGSVSGQLGITLNLADEIDQLLKQRQAADPELSRRPIRVATALDGGLRFEVDGLRYDSLEAIPDTQVQSLIRAAIADWNAKP